MIEYILIPSFIILASLLGYALRFLTKSGSVSAVFVGLLIYFGLGIKGLILLGIFFASSSLWSVYKRKDKMVVEEKHAKGSRRDYQQVLANGGMAALISVLYGFFQTNSLILAFCVFIATSNSDTWASEIGTLSKRRPYSVRTFSVVDRGTSGAVSLLGTMAAVVGAMVIAYSSYVLFYLQISEFWVIFLFGFLGNVIDTFLGAYVQALYKCSRCGVETEKMVHCQRKTALIRGRKFFNNDVVNFISGFAPAIAILLMY
ncbi:DUF92 domain-containing protein [Robertmurraya sp.]|uniref:DUF92 domain-containing protein n=1 Tax=Robertmurraya sp. TaxID=2837525 RepID=UPI003703FBD7